MARLLPVADADYFDKLADGQHPEFLWIGCSDSRVPPDEAARLARMVELNVIEQVYNLGKTSIVQKSWAIAGKPYIHGWVFDLNTGYIRPQTSMINNDVAIREICKFNNGIVGH